MASTTSSRSRHVLAPVTTNQKEVAAATSKTHVLEDENMEFTKEEVDALLNEQFKGKAQFNLKVSLVLCKAGLDNGLFKEAENLYKMVSKSLENLGMEKDNLCNMLDSSKIMSLFVLSNV
ncbi:hypothetical protein Tco_1545662 [Tanacetum coccineum]